uniref:Uncharacterized protein n=1 Tax=Mycena chlorophos TaxID=658473 RepID=A0ABQ0LWJ2_MYCCL|nr:predicted protein [Mycena chlorophos]
MDLINPPKDVDSATIFAFFSRIQESYKQALLPLFWILLDPARIPPVDDYLAEKWLLIESVIRAIRAIGSGPHWAPNGTPDIQPETRPFRQLWERMRPWVQFLFENRHLLPSIGRSRSTRREVLVTFFQLSFCLFVKDMHTAYGKPGFYEILFYTWRLSFSDPLLVHRVIVMFLPGDDLSQAQLDDALAGAGGTLDDLARTFAQAFHLYAQRVDGDSARPDRFADREAIVAAGRAIQSIDSLTVSDPRRGSGLFIDALLQRVKVGDLVRLFAHCAAIAKHPPNAFSKQYWVSWDSSFSVLVIISEWLILTSRPRLITALKQGFLTSLTAFCCRRPLSSDGYRSIGIVIENVLQPSTAMRTVNEALLPALHLCEPLSSASSFRALPIADGWDKLMAMSQFGASAFAGPSVLGIEEHEPDLLEACSNPEVPFLSAGISV